MGVVKSGGIDRALQPLHRWIWSDPHRRASKLLRFASTESDSGRDMARAAECTRDPLLRRLYLRHAQDEQKHAKLFTDRGRAILASLPVAARNGFEANWFSPGERGLDDLQVDKESDGSLLAFLHLSERAGARRFVVYQDVLAGDPETCRVFDVVIPDEAFHTNYTLAQLKRVSPKNHAWHLLWARLGRVWKSYLRLASAVANVMGGVVLTLQYFVVLPIFAMAAKRAAKRELPGWSDARTGAPLRSQY